MTPTTPLEQALAAWGKQQGRHDEVVAKQFAVDDARALGELGVFSNANISRITGLDPVSVAELTGKRDRTGGRLNPASLVLLQPVAIAWRRDGTVDVANIRNAVNLGTSYGMVAKLTGIPLSTVHRKARRPSNFEAYKGQRS